MPHSWLPWFGLLGACSALALASTAPGCSSSTSPPECVPGVQIACPCPGGGAGVTVCNAGGDGFSACQRCSGPGGDASVDTGARARDGSVDARPRDASADASDGGKRPVDSGPHDASRDSPTDARARDAQPVEGGGGCVYPTDGIDADGGAALPQPTPGACFGNMAFTCDPATHALQGTACEASEECVVYTVTEHPDPAAHPGRSYAWAGCIPAGAAPCTFLWSGFPSGYEPPGEWVAMDPDGCGDAGALDCTMAPVIADPSYASEWAGTTTGYFGVTPCASNEACAVSPVTQQAACYASPLVSCFPLPVSACSGDLLYSCDGYAFQTIVDCAAQGQVCREDCPYADGGSTNAECRDPLPPDASACTPATYEPVCVGATGITQCNRGAQTTGPSDCFMSAGKCVCYATEYPCVVCGPFSTDCICAQVVAPGGSEAECVVATSTLCDPSTTPDSCVGSVAQTCIGYVVSTDCTPLGETCAVAGGHAGCIASPATGCSTAPTPTCTGNTLSGCCPSTGQFPVDSTGATTACAPGFDVGFTCATLLAGTTCATAPGAAGGCIPF